MNRRAFLTSLGLGWVMLLGRASHAVERIAPDPRGVELVNSFLKALSVQDEQVRLQAVLPLMHRSCLTPDGRDLDRNVKEFSYRKACGGVGCYEIPAVVTEVHKGNITTIGFRETAETGRTDKYFVAKKAGVAGRPAPLHVFFPASGGAPTLVNIGSL